MKLLGIVVKPYSNMGKQLHPSIFLFLMVILLCAYYLYYFLVIAVVATPYHCGWITPLYVTVMIFYYYSLVEPKWAGTAAMISAFFLIFGIASGVNFTLLVAKLVEISA